jgi:hypothetical protein
MTCSEPASLLRSIEKILAAGYSDPVDGEKERVAIRLHYLDVLPHRVLPLLIE